MARWALAPPIIFSLLVFFLCDRNIIIGVTRVSGSLYMEVTTNYFYSMQLYMFALKLGKNYIVFHGHR